MFWDANTAPLLKNPAFFNDFEALSQSSLDGLDYIVAETSSGLTLIVNGIPLHSPDGAIAEAEAIIAERLHPGSDNIHLIFGLGFGYLAREALANSDGMVVIFEPHWPLLKFLLTEVDYSDLLSHPRVRLCGSVDQLAYTLKRVLDISGSVDGKLDGIISPGAALMFSSECLQAVGTCIEQVLGLQYNYFRMGLMMNPCWQIEALKNTAHLSQTRPLLALQNQYVGKPAVILSAGPSLEHFLHEVMYWQDRVITIAVPQAMYALQKAGFTPDFIAVLDYEGLAHQLKGIDTSQTRFLNGPFAHELAWTSPAQGRYLVNFSNYANLADWFNDATGISNVSLGSGGTVSLLAVGLASVMGCNPIVMLGQDLAFSGSQQYAGGVHVTLDGDHFEREESHISKSMRIRLVDIEGQNGEMLKTSPDYKMFRDQFSDLAKELAMMRPELRLYNSSIGGADIPGFEVRALPALADQDDWISLPLLNKIPTTAMACFNNLGFMPDLQRLEHQLQKALSLGDPLIAAMTRWQKSLRNRGNTAERSATLDNAQGHFVEALQAHWLVYGYLGQEIWAWQKLFMQVPPSQQRVTEEIAYVTQIMTLLSKQLLPTVQQTLATLRQQHLVAP
jgi:Protein of unknown function DUF115